MAFEKSRVLRPAALYFWAVLCFFTAYALMRNLIANELGLGLAARYRQGFFVALFADASLCFLPAAVGALAGCIIPRARAWLQSALSFLCFALFATQVCYFLFFRKSFEPWMLGYGAGNLIAIRGVVLHFFSLPPMMLALALFSAGLVLQVLALSKASANSRGRRGALLLAAAAWFSVVLVVKQTPVWLRVPILEESSVSQNIAWRWWTNWSNGKNKPLSMSELAERAKEAPQILNELRLMRGDELPLNATRSSGAISLLHALGPDPEKLARLRQDFGLPAQGPINVVILFMESARSFEFLHPEIGPKSYPRLHEIFKNHGVFFPQAATTASMTVQGQFTTLCSAFDVSKGLPVYTESPYLKIRCLPAVFADNGYSTYWMNPFEKTFSGKYLFESQHGMQNFLDHDTFRAKDESDSRNGSDWGVSDKVFLDQAFDRLSEIHSRGKPFFAHLLTTGTHMPWHTMAGYNLDPKLDQLEKSDPSYQGYLSSVRALDDAVGIFFDRFFKSPLARDTLIIVMSDHGTGVRPPYPALSPLQERLIWPRIILGAVTSGMKMPGERNYPVNQVDVAPLIAAVAGLSGDVTWLGRDPLEGSGTPWMSISSGRFAYRTDNRICAKLGVDKSIHCWLAANGTDPLLEEKLSEIPESPNVSKRLRKMLDADDALVNYGDFTLKYGSGRIP